MKVGSLFSGIGGLDLGLERAGMEVRWQVEINDFCRQVLEKHWPNVPRFTDIKEIHGNELEPVDLIGGGFPCQPQSYAGKRQGQDDDRWLWPDFARIVRFLRPQYVLMENVPGLFTLGFDEVVGDLAALGYNTEWDGEIATMAYASLGDGPSESASLNSSPTTKQREYRRSSRRVGPLGEWLPEPEVDRVAHGIPRRVVRPALEALGNAVVPQVAEFVGRRIMATQENELYLQNTGD